ncbi:hypothetical protein [Shewanella gaetbuli]|uniref:Uncharacterized protein n=1 Tax=Shewanella gaetbuli TaxID=220752 RepID=A0A9X2CJ61_9GAMM|nr:hypothetical protein [Shewanella gaetbuli]MCL1141706.1 hypothetical protein [Shewanella gaetbuli]
MPTNLTQGKVLIVCKKDLLRFNKILLKCQKITVDEIYKLRSEKNGKVLPLWQHLEANE